MSQEKNQNNELGLTDRWNSNPTMLSSTSPRRVLKIAMTRRQLLCAANCVVFKDLNPTADVNGEPFDEMIIINLDRLES